MDTILVFEGDNGWWNLTREAKGGLNGFHLKFDTYEAAQKMLLTILEHEFSIVER